MNNENREYSRQIRDSLAPLGKGSPLLSVAIIDGSINTQHEFLRDAKLEKIDDDQVSCKHPSHPSCQHGTFVAGLLAAKSGSGYPGLCPECKFIYRPIFCEAADLSQCPRVDESELVEAIYECMDAGANIINMSIGLNGAQNKPSAALTAAYDDAKERDVLLVAASGNQSSHDVNSLFKHPWVLPVSAMAEDGSIEPSSNQGEWIAEYGLLAPGQDIPGIDATGREKIMSGTSVAAPFVSGAAALLWSRYPNCNADDIRQALLDKSPSSPTYNNIKILDVSNSTIFLNRLAARSTQDSAIMGNTNIAPQEKSPMPTSETTKTMVAPDLRDTIAPQGCGCQAPENTNQAVYTIGIIEPHFPNLGIKNEYESAAKAIKVSAEDFYSVFTYIDPKTQTNPYQYIVQQMQWKMNINARPTYMVIPRTLDELNTIVQSLKPLDNSLQEVFSTVIGVTAATATLGSANLPSIIADHIFFFSMDELHNSLKKYAGSDVIQDVIKQLEFQPNMGVEDSDRAKNFLAFGYPEIFERTASLKKSASNSGQFFLDSITTHYSPSASERVIIEIVLVYKENNSDRKQSHMCTVDVSGKYPFINMPLSTLTPVRLDSRL